MIIGIKPAMVTMTPAAMSISATGTATAGNEVARAQAVDTREGDRRVIGQRDGIAGARDVL